MEYVEKTLNIQPLFTDNLPVCQSSMSKTKIIQAFFNIVIKNICEAQKGVVQDVVWFQ